MTKKIEWYYHRKGWTSCTRAQEFLGTRNIAQPEFILANKIKLHREEALEAAKSSDEILVAKGKKLLRFSAADGFIDDELAGVIIGRSGTLRAPAIRVGKVFLVGFHAEGYAEIFD